MRLVTWNMQGAKATTEAVWNSGVRPFFVQTHVDVAALQECGGVPSSATVVQQNFCGLADVGLYAWGTQRASLFILFYPWDTHGNRCNLALVTREQPVAACLATPLIASPWRPVLLGRLPGNPTWYGTLHAVSPGGMDAPHLLAAVGQNAVVAGDFNREPGPYAPQGWWLRPPEGPTHPAAWPTHKYDYLARTGPGGNPGQVQALHMSDHLPVVFDDA